MEIINFFSNLAYKATEPNFIGRLVQGLFQALGGTGKYWLTVVLFTLILKLATTPLDYWQRLSGKKNAIKLEKIKPQLEALQKKYGGDRNALTIKQNELYKTVGYNPLGACLPMIVMIVVMIVMFSGLNSFASYKQIQEFNELRGEYYHAISVYVNGDQETEGYFAQQGQPLGNPLEITSVTQATDAFTNWFTSKSPEPNKDSDEWRDWWDEYSTEWTSFTVEMIKYASSAVSEYHNEHKETFIWIKNIWRSDTFWTAPIPSAEDFKKLLPTSEGKIFDEYEYDNIMGEVSKDAGTANGYLILPLLAMVLMFFSSKITSKNQQTGMPTNERMQSQQKMMQWMMPLMMGVFGLIYTSAVALYMIMNSIYTVLLSFVINWLVGLQMKKLEEKTSDRPGYRR